jgi:5'-nucleotidase
LANAATLALAPVTTLGEPLSASRAGDRRLGYLIADAARESAGADFGLQNPGGVRADLPSGLVTYGDVHRVLPFDNNVVRLAISGQQLRQLVEQAGLDYYFSNLVIDYSSAADNRVVDLRFADNTPITDTGTYTLGLSDFLADGGDGFAMLPPLPRVAIGITLLDATLAYLRNLPVPVVLPMRTQ